MFSWEAACTGRAAMSLDIINTECTPAIKLSQVKPAMTELPTCQTSPICFLTLRPSEPCEGSPELLFLTTPAWQGHLPTERHGEVDRFFISSAYMHKGVETWTTSNKPQSIRWWTHSYMRHVKCSRMREIFWFSSSRWEIRITAFIIRIYCFGNGYLNSLLGFFLIFLKVFSH